MTEIETKLTPDLFRARLQIRPARQTSSSEIKRRLMSEDRERAVFLLPDSYEIIMGEGSHGGLRQETGLHPDDLKLEGYIQNFGGENFRIYWSEDDPLYQQLADVPTTGTTMTSASKMFGERPEGPTIYLQIIEAKVRDYVSQLLKTEN